MIDSHIHLTLKQYDEDRDEVIQQAKDLGVEKVVLIGCDEQSILDSVELAKKYPDFMNLAVGWHPVDVKDFSEEKFQLIKDVVKNNNVCAIGEIGLDYYWYEEEKELQKKVFRRQIELAQELDLPIIIHCREAYDDCYDILKEYSPLKGVMHSYASTPEYCQKILDLGLEIGISGPITFKNGIAQKESVKVCPIEKIHLETDGPYLTPVPFRGKRNRPEYIEYVAEQIALEKNLDKDYVLNQTAINSKRLFNLGE